MSVNHFRSVFRALEFKNLLDHCPTSLLPTRLSKAWIYGIEVEMVVWGYLPATSGLWFFSSAISLTNGWKFQGSRWKFLGMPSWKFWEELPAAGGNFEDFEMEIMKIVLENGKIFACGAIF